MDTQELIEVLLRSDQPRTRAQSSLCGGEDAEIDQRVATQLELAADKLREFRGRIEGVSPRAVLAVFGVDPSDEPTLLAGHGALLSPPGPGATVMGAKYERIGG